jgi:hypothetical protein
MSRDAQTTHGIQISRAKGACLIDTSTNNRVYTKFTRVSNDVKIMMGFI